jgi:hypothetical protein
MSASPLHLQYNSLLAACTGHCAVCRRIELSSWRDQTLRDGEAVADRMSSTIVRVRTSGRVVVRSMIVSVYTAVLTVCSDKGAFIQHRLHSVKQVLGSERFR